MIGLLLHIVNKEIESAKREHEEKMKDKEVDNERF